MGRWVWKEDDDDNGDGAKNPNPNWGVSSGGGGGGGGEEEQCSTRRIVKSSCRTEEVEPGKFVRKCEKTEEILKSCVGRPTEIVKSTTEYTEDDVTKEMVTGSFQLDSSAGEGFDFPGLHSDIESIERNLFGGFNRFFEAADEMKNGFFQAFGIPRIFDSESSPSFRREVPIEGQIEKDVTREQQNDKSAAYADISGKLTDV